MDNEPRDETNFSFEYADSEDVAPDETFDYAAFLENRRQRELDHVAVPDLDKYFVWWNSITTEDVSHFEDVVNGAADERPVQKYLEERPIMLVQALGGGHGRWAIPQKRLGSEYVPDFMVGEKSSIGFEWIAVELESPQAQVFNRGNGDPSRQLNHAIRQIQDWRSWLVSNQNYADRPRSENGLGLRNIDGNVPGLILIGRRSTQLENTNARRRQYQKDLGVKIRTYDWLLELARSRVRWTEAQKFDHD